jgi:hypothetical protein
MISYFVLSLSMKAPGRMSPIDTDRKLESTHKKVICVICYFLNQLRVTLLPLLSRMRPLPPESREPSRHT